jgi:Fanconi anemia group M protein
MDGAFIDMYYLVPHRIVRRAYQINIFNAVKDRNALVVIPTGLGKTVVALMVMAHRARAGKILVLAPTKPLCEQHHATIRELTTFDDIALVTGEVVKKDERAAHYERAAVVIATPQTVENDLDRLDMSAFSLAVFDEAHRTVGNYAYVAIAAACRTCGVQTLGLTASPGSGTARLKEVIEHLGTEVIEARTEEDPDVKPYLPPRAIRWKMIEMPQEVKAIAAHLEALKHDLLVELNKYYRVPTMPHRVTLKMLIDLQQKFHRQLKTGGKSMYAAVSMVSSVIKVYHLADMLTSQGIPAAEAYMAKIERDTSKAAKRIRKNDHYKCARKAVLLATAANPKLTVCKRILSDHFATHAHARAMVFAEYRDTISILFREIAAMPGVRPAKFIGQAKGKGDGMSQEQQKEVIRAFREGVYNVIVSTSIGEEGIDIPATSLVLFYEPVPSAIRYIQRRGRTARGCTPGEVYILIMKGSRDEAYYWSSRRKEKKMLAHIQKLQRELGSRGATGPSSRVAERAEAPAAKKELGETVTEGQSRLDTWL